MSDEEIIALYFARDEQALAQTDAKYGPYCFSLANAILPRSRHSCIKLTHTK